MFDSMLDRHGILSLAAVAAVAAVAQLLVSPTAVLVFVFVLDGPQQQGAAWRSTHAC